MENLPLTTPLLLDITGIYAGLCGLILIGLLIMVVQSRFKHAVALGDGGHPDLLQRIRCHANFVETVPLCLILLAVLELNGTSAWLLHLLGALLIVARLLHIHGLLTKPDRSFGRFTGTIGTWLVLLVGSLLTLLAGMADVVF